MDNRRQSDALSSWLQKRSKMRKETRISLLPTTEKTSRIKQKRAQQELQSKEEMLNHLSIKQDNEKQIEVNSRLGLIETNYDYCYSNDKKKIIDITNYSHNREAKHNKRNTITIKSSPPAIDCCHTNKSNHSILLTKYNSTNKFDLLLLSALEYSTTRLSVNKQEQDKRPKEVESCHQQEHHHHNKVEIQHNKRNRRNVTITNNKQKTHTLSARGSPLNRPKSRHNLSLMGKINIIMIKLFITVMIFLIATSCLPYMLLLAGNNNQFNALGGVFAYQLTNNLIANNLPPKFITSGGSNSEIVVRVKEGSASIGKLIYTLKGEDPDEDPLTFGVLGSTASDLLRIENVPGNQANVYLRKELDRETTESHQVVITLTDGKLGRGNWITKSMLIIVSIKDSLSLSSTCNTISNSYYIL